MKLVVRLGLILCSEAHLGFGVVFRGVLSQGRPWASTVYKWALGLEIEAKADPRRRFR